MTIAIWSVTAAIAVAFVSGPLALRRIIGEYQDDPLTLVVGAVAGLSAAFLLPVSVVQLRDQGSRTASTATLWIGIGCAVLLVLGVLAAVYANDMECRAPFLAAAGCAVGVIGLLGWGMTRALDEIASALQVSITYLVVVIAVGVLLAAFSYAMKR